MGFEMNLDLQLVFILAAGGVGLLLIAAYMHSAMEKGRELKQKRCRDFIEKLNRIRRLSLSLPRQFMTPELKGLLLKIEYACGERLAALGNSSDTLAKRQALIKNGMANPREFVEENTVLVIASEETGRELRSQINAMHAVLTCARADGILTSEETQRWVDHLRVILVRGHLEMFTRMSADEMKNQAPRKAKLTIERAIQYLNKHNTNGQFSEEIAHFKSSLEIAESEVLKKEKDYVSSDENLLSQSIASLLDDDDSWKKRAF